MRSDDLLLTLLREMASSPDGRMILFKAAGMDEERQRRYHHMELLADAGLAEWDEPKKNPRITNAGYDFIEAVDKNSQAMETFKKMLRDGVPLVQAVSAALSLMTT